MFVALAKLDHAVRLELGPDQRKLGRLQLIPQRVLGVFLGRGGKSHGVDVNSVHHTRQSKGSQIQGPPTTLWCGGGSAAQSGHSRPKMTTVVQRQCSGGGKLGAGQRSRTWILIRMILVAPPSGAAGSAMAGFFCGPPLPRFRLGAQRTKIKREKNPIPFSLSQRF